MRIDSSGNLLVGTTTSTVGLGNSIEGVNLRAEGRVFVSADSDYPLNLSRNTSDGDIAVFRKDGATVGSIGTIDGDLLVHPSASGHKGLRFGNGYIAPTDNSGSVQNATTDLGLATHNFKDLYLSGGVYLGGTGSANLLDDYEEGTFTPVFQNVTAPTYTNQTGSYTKIGRLVHVYISISYSALDTTDGSSLAINLPFTATAAGAFHIVESGTNTGYAGNNTISLIGSVGAGAAVISFGSTGDYNDGDYDSGNFNASGVLRFAGIYPAS